MRPTLSDPHRMTKKQQELKEAFDAFDKDGDGTINQVELQAMMEKLGDKISLEEAKLLIDEVDLDKDGAVNFNEFSVMMGVPVNKDIKINDRDMLSCFLYFDKDHDGRISQSELESVMKMLDAQLSPEEIKEMIKLADVNKDGFVDFEEFRLLVASN
ncbi:calmodulin-like protein 1 [Rhizopus microsporus ATCC 52813]|uniref:Calmodulin-like protein 1 n=1 Tax=Rhizopus microsporus ATCC 52813 TaxID=1340429 RepID=A0A2G4SX03_RHIZD|nr:calmodulin-like protein 1 [Rhizopus microsporus ATCC 52813]PHZ13301.1 calmodulin-like protein 1 [Rhizopus microsporus ATCC 52813]